MPLVTSKHIKGRSIDFETTYLITKQEYDKINQRSAVEQWDVIISMIGTCGMTYVERNHDIGYAVKNVGLFKTGDRLKALWLDYFLKSSVGRNILDQLQGGTTQAYIALGALRSLPVLVPTKNEQEAIVTLLGSLDDKIDLLHRQNKTLEAMAETLFRQWFVEEAEEGWEEFVLTDVATHCKDSVNPGKYPTRVYHHYSLPAYDEGRKPSPELGEEIKSSKYVVPENAVLISKLNPRFPRVWPIRKRKHEHPISSTEFQVFVPKKEEMFGFLYCFLISKPVQDELASAASGTSGSHQRVSPDDIKNLSFQAKSKQQLVDFSKGVDPMLEKIESNKDQVANLTALRDTLLPKLMSGEVRVECS
jgi:type I restriction enzyme S subunit